MFSSFFKSKKYAVWAWLGLATLIGSVYAQVSLTVSLNEWYGTFYNLLQKATDHSINEFWDQMLVFCKLAFPYVLIATATNWFARVYCFKWREAITFDYLPRWQAVAETIEGASQRIQEDTYRFARIVENIGLKVMRALLTLIAFVPLLWALSTSVAIPYIKDIPGSLVLIAVAVSVGGIVISWFVGIKLPGLEYNNQKCEAAFRKHLVYAEDDHEVRARPLTVRNLFDDIKSNYQRLFNHYGYFDIWSNTFEQIMVITPYLIMAPSLFAGTILLGTLIQVSNSFDKVRESFQIFISEWTTITELRSIHKRLKEFESVLPK